MIVNNITMKLLVVTPPSIYHIVRSIRFQSDMWVMFQSSKYWSNWRLGIFNAKDWERLEWSGTPQIGTIGSPYVSENPTDILFLVSR